MMESYQFLDDFITVLRPQAISDVEAIKILRAEVRPTNNLSDNPAFKEALESMMVRGWRRSGDEVARYQRQLWERNEESLMRIVNGI